MGKAPGRGDGDAIFEGAGAKPLPPASWERVRKSPLPHFDPSPYIRQRYRANTGQERRDGRKRRGKKERDREIPLRRQRVWVFSLMGVLATAQSQRPESVYFIRGELTTQIAC